MNALFLITLLGASPTTVQVLGYEPAFHRVYAVVAEPGNRCLLSYDAEQGCLDSGCIPPGRDPLGADGATFQAIFKGVALQPLPAAQPPLEGRCSAVVPLRPIADPVAGEPPPDNSLQEPAQLRCTLHAGTRQLVEWGERGEGGQPVPFTVSGIPGARNAAVIVAHFQGDHLFIGPSHCGTGGVLGALLKEGGLAGQWLSEKVTAWRKEADHAFAAREPAKAVKPIESVLSVYDVDIPLRILHARALLAAKRRADAVKELVWCAGWDRPATRAALEANADLKPLGSEPALAAALNR